MTKLHAPVARTQSFNSLSLLTHPSPERQSPNYLQGTEATFLLFLPLLSFRENTRICDPEFSASTCKGTDDGTYSRTTEASGLNQTSRGLSAALPLA
jgi:hypothetical protein